MGVLFVLINVVLITVLLLTIRVQNKTSESIKRTTKIMQGMIDRIDNAN